MNRPFLVRLADVVMFFVVAYILMSITVALLTVIGKTPGSEGWVPMFVVGAVALFCAIKIQFISRTLVDLVLLPFTRAKR